MIKFKIEIQIEEEELKDFFEENEVKFTKKKMKQIQEILDDNYCDFAEILEMAFADIVSEIIQEELE